MRAAVLALGLALAPSVATAAPAWISLTPPVGYAAQADLGQRLTVELQQARPLGDAQAAAGVEAWTGAAGCYLTWLEATPGAPEVAVRRALDDLRDRRRQASPQAGSTAEVRWDERAADGAVAVDFTWRHLSNETTTQTRALGFATADHAARIAIVECVSSATDGEAACNAALASLAIALPASARAPLGPLAAGAVPAAPTLTDASAPAHATPSLTAPDPHVLYQAQPAAKRSHGLSRWMILAGAAILGIAFWLTTRRTAAAPAGGADADADDSKGAPDE